MKTIAKLGIVFCLAGAFSYGSVWRGARLLDASCYDQNGNVRNLRSMCAPTSSTTNFVMQTRNGRIFKLDAMSNAKASKSVDDGVVRANSRGEVRARIRGTREANGFVRIDSITRGERGVY